MQHDKREDLLSENILLNLSNSLGDPYKLPDMSAYHNAREKVISKVKENTKFRSWYILRDGEYKYGIEGKYRVQIHVFCPPLLQYILFALALASPDQCMGIREFRVVIHPDDRLFDADLYSAEERHDSLLQLSDYVRTYADLEELNDSAKLATCFNQAWMDQRITALALAKRTGDSIDASEFFKESKEGAFVALTVIMSGPQVCDHITRTAPLACPNNPVQPSQIYRLQELADADDTSQFRWKTTHFCRINSP